jgi:alpha-amylase/alpha-mannosidase (GH57 family)
MAQRLLCLHGHFYQPPRENPWIEEIEIQDSAEPFHDWNERIAAECYGPNGAARIKTPADRIVDIVNNYLHLSFNFGATLLAWLERHRPDVYSRIREADATSLDRRGHGNALAQGYNHAILPLCSPRDRRTQIRWGIEDFRRRFHRSPEGFWLPETAADTATLAVLAEEGIRFTILSPYQASRVRPPGGDWLDASGARFDPTRPYRVRAGDHDLAVFFYDGHITRDLAFGDGLSAPDALVHRLEAGYDDARGHEELLTVALDGETLGHHKKGADEVLAAALARLAQRSDLEIVNLGQALDRLPLEWEAEIAECSSWSCAHGIERWRSDCGCQVGGKPGWRQAWRAPLREALDALRDRLAPLFEREAGTLLADPWRARDRFIELVHDPERREIARFFRSEAAEPLEPDEQVKALRLLEMQRQAMLMYTSCGWFFCELSGLETVQVLKYAARAIQLARDAAGVDLEEEFTQSLSRAPSNLPELGDGRQVYQQLVKPSVVSLEQVGAHFAIASLVQEVPDSGRIFCYRYQLRGRRKAHSGPTTLALGRLELESVVTGERLHALFCVLHFGASDFRCGVAPYPGPERHGELEEALFSNLDRMSLAQLLREVDRFFTGRDYTLRDLFLDERRRVAEILLQDTMRRYENDYQQIFEDNRRLMEFLQEIDSPVPGPLRVAADVSLSRRLLAVTGKAVRGELDLAGAETELGATVQLARRMGAHLHLAPVRRDVEELLRTRLSALLARKGTAVRAAELVGILDLAQRLGLDLDLWDSQNRLWDWTATPRVSLERETLADLARHLWLDEETVEARAGYAPRPTLASG